MDKIRKLLNKIEKMELSEIYTIKSELELIIAVAEEDMEWV